jgi:hypothetical protein
MPAISGKIATATRLAARAMSLLTADAIPACYTDYVYVMEFDGDGHENVGGGYGVRSADRSLTLPRP